MVFMFSTYVGGEIDSNYPTQAITFPAKNIPSNWLQYSNNGAVRLQTLGEYYRVWAPYYFLMIWMMAKTTMFEFQDVESLRCEMAAAFSSPSLRKSSYFQRARTLVKLIIY